MNVMDIGGNQAVISHDPDINLFRGAYMKLNGGADYYAAEVEGLCSGGALALPNTNHAPIKEASP